MRAVSSMLLVFLLWPAPSAAQIVNTLRGFDEQDPDWSGGVEGTVAAADGNSEYFEYELGAAIQHLAERNRWRLLGRWMDRKTGGRGIAESRLVHLRHNWRFTSTVASVAFVQATHNPFQRLETRWLVGAGGRFDVLRSDRWKGAIGVAWMYEDERIGPLPADAPAGSPDDSGRETEHRASFFLSVYSDASERVRTDVVAFWQPLPTDPGDARTFVAASVRADVSGGLYVLLRYGLNWDTNPPATVLERDQSVRGGLGLEF